MTTLHPDIPRFYLYGEPHRAVNERFVHIESLDDRSRPSEWTIRPHAHLELNHLFHIAAGGGTIRVETEDRRFMTPCLMIVPAGVVHGFSWEAESRGSVITFASTYLQEINQRDRDLRSLFRTVAIIDLHRDDDIEVNTTMVRLMRELAWAAPGHRAAADAGLLTLMVIALRRLGAAQDINVPAPGHQVELVARFRHRIEDRFRLHEPVTGHAAALGVSVSQLRGACARIAGQPPSRILEQRLVLEAKRILLYSNLSITDIAYALGFADAAYFTRFFTRQVGKSPRAFRRDQRVM